MERNKLIIEVNQYYNQIVNQISGNKLIMLELDNIAFGTFDDVEINITKVLLGERTTQKIGADIRSLIMKLSKIILVI